MRTTHSTFRLAGTTVHQITFDPTTFTDADLLWLPHHNALAHAAPNVKLNTWPDASPPPTPCRNMALRPYRLSAAAASRCGLTA